MSEEAHIFPMMLYKLSPTGEVKELGKKFDYTIVGTYDEYEAKLKDGWFPTVQEAKDKKLTAPIPPQEETTPIPPQEETTPIPPQEEMAPIPPQEEMAPIPPQEETTPIPPQEETAPIPEMEKDEGKQ